MSSCSKDFEDDCIVSGIKVSLIYLITVVPNINLILSIGANGISKLRLNLTYIIVTHAQKRDRDEVEYKN